MNVIDFEKEVETMRTSGTKRNKTDKKRLTIEESNEALNIFTARHNNVPLEGVFAGHFKDCVDKAGDLLPLPSVAKMLLSIGNPLIDVARFVWIEENGSFRNGNFRNDMPVYSSDDGVIGILSDDHMVSFIASETGLSTGKAIELWKQMKYEISVDPRFVISKRQIKTIGFKDSVGLFWVKIGISKADIDLNPVLLDEIPEFKSFLNLCLTDEDRNALVLFLGSIFDADSQRYQYLHLYGQGGEGKSTLTEMLLDLLGDRAKTARAKQIEDKHFGELLEGTRLLILPDENNPSFVQSGLWKNLTGDDTLTINPKFKSPRSIDLTFKSIITSNVCVKIGTEENSVRRLLSVKMRAQTEEEKAARGNDWKANFKNSGEKVVAYVIKEWEKAISINPGIRGKDGIPCPNSNMEAAHEAQYEAVNIMFEWANIKIVPEKSPLKRPRMKCSDLSKKLSEARKGKLDQREVSDVKAYLKSKGVNEITVKGYKYYVGIEHDIEASLRTGNVDDNTD